MHRFVGLKHIHALYSLKTFHEFPWIHFYILKYLTKTSKGVNVSKGRQQKAVTSCTLSETVLRTAPSMCLVTVCMLFCLLICQCTLTAGVLIYCLHTGVHTQMEMTRLVLSCVSYLFCVSRISFSPCIIEQRLFIQWYLTTGLGVPHWFTVVSLPHCTATAFIELSGMCCEDYEGNRWRGISFLMQQRQKAFWLVF